MISALLIKDFKFNIRYILISLLVVVGGYAAFCVDGGESSYLFSITLLPILMFGLDIGKLCYMDDRDKALTYLESLPFRKKDFIISKFIEGLIVASISILLILIENLILKNIFNIGFDISISNVIYSLTFIIFYMGMFFILYYKYNYQLANQLILFIYIVALFIIKYLSKLLPNILQVFQYKYSSIISLIISLVIYYLLYRTSCYLYKNKK